MIKVAKDLNNSPAILKSKECKEKLKQALKEKNKHEVCKTCCGKEVKEALRALYNDKCAYCESDPNSGDYMAIEHYRPRKRVKEESSHQGYYWLTYEWSNLLLACTRCNTNKSYKFPLAPTGKRVSAPIYKKKELSQIDCLANSETLKTENPLLIHPEIDEPAEHFIFWPNGEMEGVTEYGKGTIKICNLNRQHLVLDRKKIFDDFLNQINRYLLDFDKGDMPYNTFKKIIEYLLGDLRSLKDPGKPYSRFACFMFKNLKSFFIKPYMKAEHQKMLIDIYEAFIEKHR
jgi:uncharacterized protein (TIGR02646 family)